MMSKEDNRLLILKSAHEKYVEWWLPIDLACDSCMAPMSCHRFCETLLTYKDDWFNRWLGDDIPEDKIVAFKTYILKIVIGHYTNIIDLNENE